MSLGARFQAPSSAWADGDAKANVEEVRDVTSIRCDQRAFGVEQHRPRRNPAAHVHDQRRGPPGTAGRLFRSRNHGTDWHDAGLPGELESSAYFLAVNPADPKLIYAAATLGQIYRSIDGGESWTALKRRLGEIRALAWLPDR